MQLSQTTSRKLAAARDLLAVAAFCAAVFYGGRAFINSPYLQKERVTQREAAADIETFFRLAAETRPAPAAGETGPDLRALKAAAHAEAEARLDEFKRVTVRDLAFILYRAAAAFGESETRLLWQPRRKYRDPELKFPPFTAEYREGKFFIRRAADPALTGAELLQINGVASKDYIRPALERISGETPALRAWLFCRDQAFWWEFAALVAADKPLEIKARTGPGKTLARRAAPVTAGEFRRLSDRHAPQHKMIYSQSKLAWLQVYDLEASRNARRFNEFFFGEARTKGAQVLVLDLREAAVGERKEADRLAALITGFRSGTPAAKAFLLIGPGTGPAAAYLAARFRELGAGEILGGETGGTPAYFGDPETFTLPASGLKFSVASRRYPYPVSRPGGVPPDTVLTAELLRPFKGDLKAYIMKRTGVSAK
ncbi:MAG: hypothetical protein PHV33_02180 [Elusimicrobiales bacterium]|nr:hypothetical protein [Elusimicrobiales bacterium]